MCLHQNVIVLDGGNFTGGQFCADFYGWLLSLDHLLPPQELYEMSSLSAGLGLVYTAIVQYLSALSSGNFSLFCKLQNNFRFLGQIAVLLDVDAAADVVADWRRKTDRVLRLFVLSECNAHFLILHS